MRMYYSFRNLFPDPSAGLAHQMMGGSIDAPIAAHPHSSAAAQSSVAHPQSSAAPHRTVSKLSSDAQNSDADVVPDNESNCHRPRRFCIIMHA